MNHNVSLFIAYLLLCFASRGLADELSKHIFVVPPTFVNAADHTDDSPHLLSPRERLEQIGLVFGPGAHASYNPETSQLTITNTKDQIELFQLRRDELILQAEKQIFFSITEARFSNSPEALGDWWNKHIGPNASSPVGNQIPSREDAKKALINYLSIPAQRSDESTETRRLGIAAFLSEFQFENLIDAMTALDGVDCQPLPPTACKFERGCCIEVGETRVGIYPELRDDQETAEVSIFLTPQSGRFSERPGETAVPISASVRSNQVIVLSEVCSNGMNRVLFLKSQILDPAGMPVFHHELRDYSPDEATRLAEENFTSARQLALFENYSGAVIACKTAVRLLPFFKDQKSTRELYLSYVEKYEDMGRRDKSTEIR